MVVNYIMKDEWDVTKTEETWDDDVCKYCGEFIVTPQGRKTSKILLISDQPEPRNAYAMSEQKFSILKSEMAYVQLDMLACRCITMWKHVSNNKNECLLDGIENVLKEVKDKVGVLLIGSVVTNYFTGYGVMDINGLNVTSKYFQAPVIMGCIDPNVVFGGTVGELRFALKQFAKELNNVN